MEQITIRTWKQLKKKIRAEQIVWISNQNPWVKQQNPNFISESTQRRKQKTIIKPQIYSIITKIPLKFPQRKVEPNKKTSIEFR